MRARACLLADEPFLGITPADTEVFIAAFQRLAQCGTAVIVTGHEVPFILAVADRVTGIHSGTTRPLGDRESARRRLALSSDYLGIGAA